MIELTYLSHATKSFSEAELFSLLQQARSNNGKRDVTGVLLFDGDSMFIQVLEGPEERVDALFEIIKKDPRHSDIYQLGRRDVDKRTFNNWEMGFKNLSDHTDANIPGFSSFLEGDNTTSWANNNKSFAVQVLDYFKEEYIGDSGAK